MTKNFFLKLFIFFTSITAVTLHAQMRKSDVEITEFYKFPSGNFVCELNFALKNMYSSDISRESIVKFIVDSTNLLSSSNELVKFNNEEWDDKNRFLLYQEKFETGKKNTTKFKISLYLNPPYTYDFSKNPSNSVFKLSNGSNMLYMGPFQRKEFYNPNGNLKCNDCEPHDSLRLMLRELRNSEYDIKVLRENAKSIESHKLEKAEYEKYIDSLGVLSIINEGIRIGDLNEQNCKSGVVLTRFNEKLKSNFSKGTYYFNDDELERIEMKYIGSISPVSGILQCRIEGVLLTEYEIIDSVVTALRIYERLYNKPTGELIIDLVKNKYKAIYYIDYRDLWTYCEGSMPKNIAVAELQNIKKIRKYLYVYSEYNNIENEIKKNIAKFYESGERSTYQGIPLSSVTHKELTDELLNSEILLTKTSPSKYRNKNNVEYDYFHLNFHTNDSVSHITRIAELNGGKKYLQTYTFTKGSLLKEFYHNWRVDSTYSEHEIQENKWKSKTPTAHIPLAVSTKRLTDSLYHVQYRYNKKLLFDATMNTKSEIVGEANIYSISSPVLKQYRTSRLNVEDKINSIFKISLSFYPIKNEYSSALSSMMTLRAFSPNDNKTIGLEYLNTYLMPLATSPLGTEIALKGSPAFVDRTGDYLAQKAIFKNGKILALYIFLPDGVCFDSLNLGLNEYGEQIGKSSVNEFPLSERYMTLYNKSQKELEDRQMQAMAELLRALQKNNNTCDHCKKTITGERIDIIDMDCPNGHSYMLNSKRSFCSLKCHSDYKKYWCDLQDN